MVELCHLVQTLGVCFVFFDNFVNLCEQKEVKPSRALTEAGVPKSAFTYWKSEAKAGNDAKPTNQNAVKLAQYFDVSVDYLLTGEQKENPPQPQNQFEADMEWVKQRLMAMPEDKRDAMMQMIKNSVE